MNRGRTNSNDYEEHNEHGPEKKDKNKHDEQTVTILKCGTVSGSAPTAVPGIVLGRAVNGIGGGGCGFQPVVQAAVTLDTSEIKNVTVKIDFSSLITFKTCGDDNYFLRLVFKLIKICDGAHIPLGSWTFEQVSNEGSKGAQVNGSGGYGDFVQETDPFCFTWCECDDDCSDCCRYIVELVDQQTYNIEFFTITNIALTALASGKKKSHRW